ncbi:MAG: purine-binding chemotaxis protein CheW [Chloroflexi bacterium]|nr:purine-binding chemotaxis protein CheW [Chloroflexota bacterium]
MANESSKSINFEAIWHSLDWQDDSQLVAIQKRLRQRAQQYAAPPKQRVESDEVETALVFHLGEEVYGVDVMLVRAVRPVSKITRVPGTPPFYRGVMNIRGQITTVMDLRLFFDLPVNETQPPLELVVMRAVGLEIGFLAHEVSGVVSIPRAAIQMPGETRFARGVTAERMVLLNVGQIFESERLVIGGGDE